MLFDIRRLEWSDELCDLFSVPTSCLPEVRPSSGRLGVTHPSSGLPAGLPIAGVAGDQQAGAVRPSVLRARHDEEHLWHRFVRADERRRPLSGSSGGLAHHRRLDAPWYRVFRRADRLCVRGGDLLHRLGHPMAAGRPRDHRRGGRGRAARRELSRHRGSVPGARVHRARESVVGPLCRGRRSSGSARGNGSGPPRSSRGGGDGLPDARRRRGDVGATPDTRSPHCGQTVGPL